MTAPSSDRPPRDDGAPGPKALLALDGGGIRGLITIEVLARIETVLRERLGRGPDFRLADVFDYVGGTSTGGIIATCVSVGMSVDEIRAFYLDSGQAMFKKARLFDRFRHLYRDHALKTTLQDVLGAETTLGSDRLRTLLLLVMRNATTDSPWPLSNNPSARYNLRDREHSNLDLPLWQLVRASTAAPLYFPPEVVDVGGRKHVFVDGGVTPYNNPAFLLFTMATAPPYRLEWPTGPDDLLLISVGTGAAAAADAALTPRRMTHVYNAKGLPVALMYGASNQQDLLCRLFSRTRAGAPLDRELGDLHGVGAYPPLFTYARYDADLSRDGLDALGLADVEPGRVQKLDAVDAMAELQRVGRAVAEAEVRAEHFDGFVPAAAAA
ncbi:patatin-like phospholipase family protein [Rubrivirga sp.]|uniref:patatin-like phospholipase family protein n=1 Tax=Rubrivirga sp. TaxID=1885344 RepID=UPI003B520C8F